MDACTACMNVLKNVFTVSTILKHYTGVLDRLIYLFVMIVILLFTITEAKQTLSVVLCNFIFTSVLEVFFSSLLWK